MTLLSFQKALIDYIKEGNLDGEILLLFIELIGNRIFYTEYISAIHE